MALSFDVCDRAQSGQTPLHLAVSDGHLECARLLMERGADKEAKAKVPAPHAPLPQRSASERFAFGASSVAAFVRRRAAPPLPPPRAPRRRRAPRLLIWLVVLRPVCF